jgi:hypothetical protein
MAEVITAITDFLAAIFGRFGIIGRPRRRAELRKDLDLLRELEKFEDFGRGTETHDHLKSHIAQEIDALTGVGPKREISWAAVAWGVIFTAPFVYLTYTLDKDRFTGWSLIPGCVAFLFFVVTLILLRGEVKEDDTKSEHPNQSDAVSAG